MKTNRSLLSVRNLFAALAVGVMTACVPVYHHGHPTPHHAPRVVTYDYWYYPAIGAYFDPRARVYIYYEHNHWIRARVLPVHVRPYIGRYVTIRTVHEQPYQEYTKHRDQYTPERYRKEDSSHRHDNVWVGPPRKSDKQQDKRGKNGNDQGQDADRNGKSGPSQYRAPDSKNP